MPTAPVSTFPPTTSYATRLAASIRKKSTEKIIFERASSKYGSTPFVGCISSGISIFSSGGLCCHLTEEAGKRNEVVNTDVDLGINISIPKLSAPDTVVRKTLLPFHRKKSRAADSHGCPLLSVHAAKIPIVTLITAAGAPVEVVLGGIRNERHLADILQGGTAR